MHLKTIKKEKDVPLLGGTKVSFETVDGSLKAVTIAATDGTVLHVRPTPYGDALVVTTPAGPPMVKRYKVSGTVHGIEFSQLYESEWDAKQRVSALESAADDAAVQVTEVDVPEDQVP